MSQNIIGFLTKNFGSRSIDTLQRPNNTTAYDAGDVIATDGVSSTGTLTLNGTVSDGETFTVGSGVYEIDTDGDIESDAIKVDVSSYLVSATGTLTIDTQPTVGDSISIGDSNSSRSYYFTDDAELSDPYILIGAELSDTQASIVSIINGSGNEILSLGDFSENVSTVTATIPGAYGNGVSTLSTFTAETNMFSGENLSGGEDCSAADAVTAIVGADAGDNYVLSEIEDNIVGVTANKDGVWGDSITIGTTIVNSDISDTNLSGGVDATCFVFEDIIRNIGINVVDRMFSTIGAKLVIGKSSIPSGMTSFRLHLYSDVPVPISDNESVAIDDDDINIYLGYIDIKTPTDVGNALISCVDDINFAGIIEDNSRIVYGVLETVTGFTPVSNTNFTVSLYSIGV